MISDLIPTRLVLDGRVRYARHELANNGEMSVTWCAGPADLSPVNTVYRGACGSCWLGHSHTEELHDERLAEHYAG